MKKADRKKERFRNEWKYLISTSEKEVLNLRMKPLMKLDPHAENGGYLIRSLYFDDYWNSAYEEKESGTVGDNNSVSVNLDNGKYSNYNDYNKIELTSSVAPKGAMYKTFSWNVLDSYQITFNTSKKQRQKILDTFNKSKKVQIICTNPIVNIIGKKGRV